MFKLSLAYFMLIIWNSVSRAVLENKFFKGLQ